MHFFQGEYVFRSRNGVLATMLPLAVGGTFAGVSYECFRMNAGRLSIIVGGSFAIVSVFFLLAGCYVMSSLLVGRRVEVAVSKDGITHGKRFIPWVEISEFYATIYSNGVCLAYTPVGRGAHLDTSMPTTPLLSYDDYRMLAETLRDRVAPFQTHVVIEAISRQPVGD